MRIDLRSFEYDPDLHDKQPESPEEAILWVVLDYVDALLVETATQYVLGAHAGPSEDVPPGSLAARKALVEAQEAYLRDVVESLTDFRSGRYRVE